MTRPLPSQIYAITFRSRKWAYEVTNVVKPLYLHLAHANRADKHGVTQEMLARENGQDSKAEAFEEWLAKRDEDLDLPPLSSSSRRPRSVGQDAEPEPHVCPAPHANSDPNIRYYISSETWVICRMLDTEHPILHIFTRQPTAPNFDFSPSPLESSPLSD